MAGPDVEQNTTTIPEKALITSTEDSHPSSESSIKHEHVSEQPIPDEEMEDDGAIRVGTEATLTNVKTTKDGKIALIPQPSDDPLDPLNWSWTRKHLVLLSLFTPALLTDFGMTWGTTLFQAQAPTFQVSVAKMINSVSGGIFLQGPGGVFAVPFCQRYGRLPILFWSQLLACACVIGASQAPDYASFTAARTLQGWFNTAPQVIGLSIVGDMFFFHERTIRVNIWAFSFILGPFLGPFISAFLLQKIDWRADYGVLAAFYGFSLLGVIFLGDETLYDRGNPQPYPTGIVGRIAKLTGFASLHKTGRPSLATTSMQILRLAIRPEVLLVTAGFLMILFMWVIGIVTTISVFLFAPPYNFTPTAFALFFLGPIIGAIIGEFWGHFFNDWLCNRYMLTHRGIYVPENRLWGAYPAAFIGFTGLILFGQTLAHQLTWFGLCFGWAIYVFSMVTGTTAVSAYLLDSFPADAALVSGILNFWRTTGGFCVSYFQLKWVARNGAGVSFGCQAAILGASFVTIVATQIWGKKWRSKGARNVEKH